MNKKLCVFILSILTLSMIRAVQAKEQAAVSLGGMAWFHSDRKNQLGSNRLAAGNFEYLHVGTLRIPIGLNYFISQRHYPAVEGSDELKSFSLVSGYQFQREWFDATTLIGLGWAKGRDVVEVIREDGSFGGFEQNMFSTLDVPLILRGTFMKKWNHFSLGAGPELSVHLNSQNVPSSFGIVIVFGYQ